MNISRKFLINKSLISAELDDEICLFDEERAEYINLNETGSYIWHFLKDTKDINEIFLYCKKTYNIDDKELLNEIVNFLNKALEESILLEIV